MTQESSSAAPAGIAPAPGAGSVAAPSAGAPAAGNAAASTNWLDGVDAGAQAWVTSKGYKSLNDVITSANSAEKLLGAGPERLIKLPNAQENTPETWNAIYDRLGRPKTPQEYGLVGPDGKSTPFADAVAPKLHEIGLTTKQAGELNKWWNEYMGGIGKQQQAELEAKQAQESAKLREEWGAAYEQNSMIADSGAEALGLTDEQVKALGQVMGPAAALKMLHSMGVKAGDPQHLITGDSRPIGGKLTQAQALAEREALMKDQNWVARWMAKDVEAVRRLEQLNQWAFPGETPLGMPR